MQFQDLYPFFNHVTFTTVITCANESKARQS